MEAGCSDMARQWPLDTIAAVVDLVVNDSSAWRVAQEERRWDEHACAVETRSLHRCAVEERKELHPLRQLHS
jgi:hypothetical protein